MKKYSYESWSTDDCNLYTSLVYYAHKTTRMLAKSHLHQLTGNLSSTEDIEARASSALSLRDILRCFKVFQYLKSATKLLTNNLQNDTDSWLIAVGIVYYLRLGIDSSTPDGNYRRQFLTEFKRNVGSWADIETNLEGSMDNLMKYTELEPGIACTLGLQENLFVVLICLLAKVPAIVIGPPGSSKTLSVNVN